VAHFMLWGVDVGMHGRFIRNVQRPTAHESPRMTKLYDRTGDAITLDEVERIRIEGT
jgi:hypothetical protein